MPLAVCATPIGNLADITLRVLEELREADLLLCEDTRHTGVLLARHGIEARAMQSYHRHNEARRVAELLPRLAAGDRVALVSDAGLPGVNDPGLRLVRAALDAGIPVTVLPGPTAVAAALVLSGFEAMQFRFVGWLPRRPTQLEALWAELAGWEHPTIAFESPQRLPGSLASLAAVDPEREVVVCRELTKRFEEVVRGNAATLAHRFDRPARGEITVVIGPATVRPVEGDDTAAVAAVAELTAAGAPRRVAADVVARLTGVSRNRLYRRSL